MNKTASNFLNNGIETLKDDKNIEHLIAKRGDYIFSLLAHYINEIELFNKAYGLVSVKSAEELVVRHILDSLAPLGIILRLLDIKTTGQDTMPCAIQIADAGSGAGLPGIPLAITLPDCHFTLIERMGRRAGFLLNTKAVIGLSNITVEEGEIEKTSAQNFAMVTFRGFKPLDEKLLKTLFNACAKDGVIAAYKGKRKKIETEMAPLEKFCSKWESIPYIAPFLEEERHLLIIRP
uniref:Ribosomal RNA small subunit methyltransferase G n=1 Tax=uncultured bacterium contig00011 TaxID=1181503 RepID=A0A806KIH5_9BACT|nr:rRNA small subunit 7-methylguanosine (m7G) methyltransferase GidB [uncultured bacterium contig00011]